MRFLKRTERGATVGRDESGGIGDAALPTATGCCGRDKSRPSRDGRDGHCGRDKSRPSRRGRLAKLVVAAVGSWRVWAAAAATATTAAVATVVLYKVAFADGDDAGSYPYYKLIRTSTDPADRLLLMNRIKTSVESPVDYHNYTGKTAANETRNWWEVVGAADASTLTNFNLEAGSHIRLHAKGTDGTVLWEMFNCRIGNLNPKTMLGSLQAYQNALPWSKDTAYSYRARTSSANQTTAGTLVMQNTPDARVVSSCLADGIGTVYFDAVNGFTGYMKGQLAVEVAYGVFKTNETGAVVSTKRIPDDLELEKDADGNDIPGQYVAPDAAHCDEIRVVSGTSLGEVELAETNAYGRCAWVRVNLTGYAFGNDKKPLATNDVLNLEMPLSGAAGSFANFYRVWAPVQDAAVNPSLAAQCRGPMRLQIRRLDDPGVLGTPGIDLDGGNLGDPKVNGLISLDNIIVSCPAMQARAVPLGAYVEGGSSRNVIGWSGVLSTAYPRTGESGLTATAGLSLVTNAPPDSSVSDAWTTAGVKTTLKWRERYLDMTNDWQSLALSVVDGALVSTGSLTLPDDPCDVEFYYDTELDAPYYGYVDYTGLDVGTPGYSERVTRVETHFDASAADATGLPSTGEEFFFRLREGKSDQLEYRVQVRSKAGAKTAFTNEIPFHVTGDRTWKAFVKMTTNETVATATALQKGDYEFRIVGVNPSCTYGGNEVTSLPWSGKRLFRDTSADGSDAWTAFSADAVTGALLFQLVENETADGASETAVADEMTYTLVHADYQDFNTWSDAASTNLYVGAYSDSKGRQSGSSPDTKEFPGEEEMGAWSTTVTSNATYWTETFATTATPEDGWGNYAAYESFTRCLTPNGWLAQNGQWVCAKWRESSKGGDMALLLDGDSSGSLSFTNPEEKPHGVDTFTLSARVAQAAKFEDFAYYSGEAAESMQDYVFTVRAVMGTSEASTDFAGNGSVSVVGYYRPMKGCYELRAERIANNTIRFSLYKWEKKEGAKKTTIVPRLLGRHTTTRAYASQTYLRCSNAGNTTALQREGYYGELFIRCRTTGDGTIVEAGVMDAGKKLSDGTSGTSHYCLKYTDTDSPYTFGSFGFGSLNCPAQFIKPQRYANGTAGTFPNVTGKTKDSAGADVANPACGNGSVTYSGSPDDLFYSSLDGEVYRNWVFDSSRFAKADIGGESAVTAVAPTGQLELFVTENNTERSVGTVDVTGFTYDTNCTFTVRNTADSLLRLATASESDDIVVDDLSFSQWSAASYGDSGNSPFYVSAYSPGQACPNYYVYQNGWVNEVTEGAPTNRTITLAPARAKANANGKLLVAIRSPLMDGERKVQGGSETRGIGLGMMSFTYRNADSNCVVHVQWARCDTPSALYNVTEEGSGAPEWKTVKTFDFSTMTAAERASGTLNGYVGQHGTNGVMRLAIDTNVVAAAQNEATNPGKDASYGAIEIVSFLSRDEPALDERCWWGWNLRSTDAASERSLYDSAPADAGMALALNNSVTDAVDADTAEIYPQHLPFVQTPTFATNLVGEVSFRARRLPGAAGPTEVAVFGAKDGGVSLDSEWVFLTNVVVTCDAYRQFTYRTPEGQDYAAFRLAVIGVTGLVDGVPNHKDEMDESLGGDPARVLLDEVYVSEAVRGQLAFRDVGAFRGNLSSTAAIADVTAKSNQPMVNESWGVQGEVYVAQMEEELDLDKGVNVFFSWYRSTEPWGYANWRALPAAKRAQLSRATGTTARIFRSSYDGSPEAVVLPTTTNEVVQYVLEVEYYAKGATTPSTNVLSAADWTRPAWYHPVDFNAGSDAFAAYTILDTVAPGWAWINEVNVFGTVNSLWENSDAARQFIEVAMPQEADLTGWEVRLLDGDPDSTSITTNLIAKFGYEVNGTGKIPATKTKNAASNCVFMVLASQPTKAAGALSEEDGEIDGYWRLANRGTGQTFEPDHSLGYGTPFGIQLVRPSGVIEHEVVVRGEDLYAGTIWGGEDPQKYVDNFNANEEGGAFFFAGSDDSGDVGLTLGVLSNAGATSNDWSNAVKWSPGRINEGQVIDPEHPTPFGSSVVVYLNVGRYLQQTATASDGTATVSRDNLVQVVPKGDAKGLVVDYLADPWYELGSVTTNGVAATPTSTGTRAYRLTVAQDCSNDTITVNAETAIQKELSEKYGLTDDNRYRDAVMAWLRDGKSVDGTAWTGTEGDVHLAEFRNLAGDFVTNLTLTAMYWLDIPPTEPGWILRGGMADIQPHAEQLPSGSGLTNVQVSVYMAISNKNATASSEPHPPTVLRGLAPGETSRDYDITSDSAPAWTSVTFKVTGFMPNGLTSKSNPDNWVPLRWFVFDENSFYPRGDAKEFQSVIDVRYPYTKESPAQSYGLSEWMRVHAGEEFPLFTYFWAIDDRLKPVTAEILKPDSTY